MANDFFHNRKSYEELTSSFSKLLLDQEQLSQEKKNVVVEVKNLEKQQKVCKFNSGCAKLTVISKVYGHWSMLQKTCM